MINFTSEHKLSNDVRCGDKSISHRALILASVAQGKSVVKNISLCDDVLATVDCLRALGAKIELCGTTATITPITKPNSNVLMDCKNSGTTARLLAGLAAGLGVTAKFVGDESLSKRPMQRVLQPLRQMGAQFASGEGFLFQTLGGKLRGTEIIAQVNSAQVKSAVLLAAIFAEGNTVYHEQMPTRNHTELLLQALGGEISVKGNAISVTKSRLEGFQTTLPNDPSSVAFSVALALLDGREQTFPDVCVNPRRTGFLRVLERSGADVVLQNKRIVFGERVADIHVKKSRLKALRASESEVCDAIDEVPILAALSLTIKGTHRFCGVRELQFKESNRIEALKKTAEICRQSAVFDGDALIVRSDGVLPNKPFFDAYFDHRIAMSQAVLCLGVCGGGSVDQYNFSVSFPDFLQAVGVAPLRFGLVGSDIEKSLSPMLMRHLAQNANVCCSYDLFPLPCDVSDRMLADTIKNLDGANVTMPFKARVARLFCASCPSVNTVGKSIRPQSTDDYGVLRCLTSHGVEFENSPLWVVGAGGAAEACVRLLKKYGAKIQIVNRTPSHAARLTQKYGLCADVQNPVGVLSFVPECDFEKQLTLPQSVKFVLVASYKGQSGLAEQAKSRRLELIDGREMLYHQGAKSFSLWTDSALQTDYARFAEEEI